MVSQFLLYARLCALGFLCFLYVGGHPVGNKKILDVGNPACIKKIATWMARDDEND